MATKFPKFSQALAQDPATRRIWYGIATAHDLEAHDGMTCLLYTSPSPRDRQKSRMPSSA